MPAKCDTGRSLLQWTSSGAYLLFVLALVSTNQYASLYLFSVALESIKAEFHLSDGSLGALNGPAFLVFLGIAGIPMAHLAERIGWRQAIAASVAAWSVFTAMSALATGFLSLFFARALVGVGQSGCNPVIQSLIAGHFPRQHRSGAMAVMYAGLFLGVLLGLSLGSVVIQVLGWRGAFLIAGASGIALVPLVWSTLQDPPLPVASLFDTIPHAVVEVLHRRGIIHYLAMYALMGLVSVGTFTWAPTFYSRYYEMNPERVGALVGFILGGGTSIATLVGGIIVNRLDTVREDAASSFMLWCTCLSGVAGISAFLVENWEASLALLLLWTFAGCLPAGRTFAMLHELVEPRHRAVAAALAVLAASLIGGTGPLLVGVISDVVGAERRDALRVGLMCVNLFTVWTLLHMYALIRAYRD